MQQIELRQLKGAADAAKRQVITLKRVRRKILLLNQIVYSKLV